MQALVERTQLFTHYVFLLQVKKVALYAGHVHVVGSRAAGP